MVKVPYKQLRDALLLPNGTSISNYAGSLDSICLPDGRLYLYSSASTATVDTISVLSAGGKGAGRWLLQVNTHLMAYMFPSLQAAINAAQALGCPLYLRPRETYTLSAGVTGDFSRIRLVGFGSVINYTATSGAVITVTGDGVNAPYYQTWCGIEGISIKKTNSTAGTVVGILFDNATEGGSSHIRISQVNVYSCDIGMQFKRNCYVINVNQCDIHSCTLGIDIVASINAGERMAFKDLTVYNGGTAVRCNAPDAGVYFTNCSFDYNLKQIEITAGKMWFNSGHIESRNYANYPITVSGDGTTLHIRDSWIVCTELTTMPPAYINNTMTGNGRVTVDECFINNVGTTSGVFADGTTATYITGTSCYGTALNMGHSCLLNNRLLDGSFELATFVDRITAVGTSMRMSATSMTNCQLSISTADKMDGNQAMRWEKIYGGGSESRVQFMIPVRAGAMTFADLMIKKTGTIGNGPIYISFIWAAAVRTDPTTGVTTALKQLGAGSLQVDIPTGSHSGSYAPGPLTVSPPWAEALMIDINAFNLAGGDGITPAVLCVDKVRATQW